jgi:galactokinase
MTGAALAAALVTRGLNVDEQSAKQGLFALVLARLDELDRGGDPNSNRSDTPAPVHAWWVPGRLEVFGTHTDYAGGHTLVCAVPRGFAVVARRRTDNVVYVVDALREQDVSLVPEEEVLDSTRPTHQGWRRYVAAVCRRLARNFPGARLGTNLVLASDLPRASGMSSSSALVVAVATALVEAGSLRIRVEWQRNIAGSQDEAGYYACMENGLSFGSLSGDGGVGTHGGSEDHAAILTGTAEHLSAFTFVPMCALEIVRMPPSWRFVLTPSGVPAQKAGVAREAYNRLADGTRILLQLWNRHSRKPSVSLRAALMKDANETLDWDHVAQLQGFITQAKMTLSDEQALVHRLLHFVREDFRTIESIDAFRRGDHAGVGKLAADSQSDAETFLGNQIPETIALAASARKLGAFAARSFGAGFGGSVWALVDADRAQDFAHRWAPDAFVAMPGPPLLELTSQQEKGEKRE